MPLSTPCVQEPVSQRPAELRAAIRELEELIEEELDEQLRMQGMAKKERRQRASRDAEIAARVIASGLMVVARTQAALQIREGAPPPPRGRRVLLRRGKAGGLGGLTVSDQPAAAESGDGAGAAGSSGGEAGGAAAAAAPGARAGSRAPGAAPDRARMGQGGDAGAPGRDARRGGAAASSASSAADPRTQQQPPQQPHQQPPPRAQYGADASEWTQAGAAGGRSRRGGPAHDPYGRASERTFVGSFDEEDREEGDEEDGGGEGGGARRGSASSASGRDDALRQGVYDVEAVVKPGSSGRRGPGRPRGGRNSRAGQLRAQLGSDRFEEMLLQKAHVHRQLNRNLRTWKDHFLLVNGREPEWLEMPPAVQRLELAYNALTHMCARARRDASPATHVMCRLQVPARLRWLSRSALVLSLSSQAARARRRLSGR